MPEYLSHCRFGDDFGVNQDIGVLLQFVCELIAVESRFDNKCGQYKFSFFRFYASVGRNCRFFCNFVN